MSNGQLIDKNHRLHFTQNYTLIMIRCPICVKEKIARHCKIFKNLPSLWIRIKKEFSTSSHYFKLEEIIELLENIDKALKWEIITPQIKDISYENRITRITENNPATTTSSSLFYNGRTPRLDVVIKLRKIAELLQIQSEFYPNFKPRHLEKFIRIVIGNADSRTVKKYLKCITDKSEKDRVHGKYDVRGFCTQALNS